MSIALLLPFIGAFFFWLAFKLFLFLLFRPYEAVSFPGFKWQGVIPVNKEQIAGKIADAIQKELQENEFIKEKLTGPETLAAILPEVEKHIDNFLTVKLKIALPVISIFIGDKVTNQLKELFMQELETLFPSVMSQIFSGLQQNTKLIDEIRLKLCSVSVKSLEKTFYREGRLYIRKAAMFFAIAGFFTGLIHSLLVLLFVL